ncbi:MAG: hypothetical protein GX316_03220 [Firmicutes bacterium]|nr:hypothetical protein [Bacillota bacterium]
MKTFITVNDLNDHLSKGSTVLRLGEGDVLTAAAAEEAERLGITVDKGAPSADPVTREVDKEKWAGIQERRMTSPMIRGKKPTGCLGEKEYLIGESSIVPGSSSKAKYSTGRDDNLDTVLGEIRNLVRAPGRS